MTLKKSDYQNTCYYYIRDQIIGYIKYKQNFDSYHTTCDFHLTEGKSLKYKSLHMEKDDMFNISKIWFESKLLIWHA